MIDSYVEPVNIDRAMAGARLGMSDALDGDSAYLDPEDFRQVQEQPARDSDADLGLLLRRPFSLLIVASTRSGSPAEKAGIRPGDVIKTIDGRHTRAISAPVGQRMLRGAPLRIGFDPTEIDASGEAGYAAALRRALEQCETLGAALIEMTLPPIPGPPGSLWFTLAAYEAYQWHRRYFIDRPDGYGEYFSGFLRNGASIYTEAYEEARLAARTFAADYRRRLASVAAVAGPAAGPAFPITAEVLYGPPAGFDALIPLLGLPYTLPANLAGVPTVCLPCGFSAGGVPFSLQLTGPPLSEPMLLRLAHGYEEATAWHSRHPPA